MKKVKRTNVLMEKKRYKMFKSKKKWLIAPLFFLGVGLGTAFEPNEVKADVQTPSSSTYTEASSSGASSGQNSASSSAATDTQSSATSASQSKSSVASTDSSSAASDSQSSSVASASQSSNSAASASQGSKSASSASASSSSESNASDGSASQGSSSAASAGSANSSSASLASAAASAASSASASSASSSSSSASSSNASASSVSAAKATQSALAASSAAATSGSSVDVSTASDFNTAMANSAVSEINVQADFVDDVSGADRQTYAYRPNLVINGNGHTIDFRKHWYEQDATATQNESLTINDLTMYGYSYWGPVTIMGVNPNSGYDHSVTFNNVTYTGAQLMYGRTTKVYIKGKTTVNSVKSYTSPFDNSTQLAQPGDGSQQNFEVSYMEVEAGATYTGTTYSGTAVQVHNGGSFIVDKGATVDLQRTSATGANEDGFNALIYTSGSVEFKEGSKVTLNKNKLEESNFSPIYIDTGANLTVDKDAVVNIYGAEGNTPVRIAGSGTVNLNEGSSMTISTKPGIRLVLMVSLISSALVAFMLQVAVPLPLM